MRNFVSMVLSTICFATAFPSLASPARETRVCHLMDIKGMSNDGRFLETQTVSLSRGKLDLDSIATDGDTHWVKSAKLTTDANLLKLTVEFKVDSQPNPVIARYRCGGQLHSVATMVAQPARSGKFRCSNVGGIEEWVIKVDLKSRKASFFDNDANVVANLVGIEGLESTSSPVIYRFEGNDSNSSNGDRLRIIFAMDPYLTGIPTASVTTELGKSGQRTFSARTCVEDNRINL